MAKKVQMPSGLLCALYAERIYNGTDVQPIIEEYMDDIVPLVEKDPGWLLDIIGKYAAGQQAIIDRCANPDGMRSELAANCRGLSPAECMLAEAEGARALVTKLAWEIEQARRAHDSFQDALLEAAREEGGAS